jgi:hypothetical protein
MFDKDKDINLYKNIEGEKRGIGLGLTLMIKLSKFLNLQKKTYNL